MSEKHQAVNKGDQFRDNDPRLNPPRIVRVHDEQVRFGEPGFIVENVEHWNEKLIGRRTWISARRLTLHSNRQTGYTKVSR